MVIVAASVGIALVGCSAQQDEETPNPSGATSSALEGCSMTRAKILRSAPPKRKQAVERGFAWLDDDVPYSQSASHEGYRTDCSGFVSMCWSLGRSSNTSAFYGGDANKRLGSYDDLLVADALVKQGHIVLFLGWNDAAKTGACVLEQASTASDMQFRVRSRSSLVADGYKAIRANVLASETDKAPPTIPTPEPKADPAPAPRTDPTPPPVTAPASSTTDDPSNAPATSPPSSVTPQAEDSGDDGDPDEKPSAHNTRTTTAELASAGCSSAPNRSPNGFALFAVVVFFLLRWRKSSASGSGT